MRTTYGLTAHALCPVDGAEIAYDLAITVDLPGGSAMIEVELLIPLVADLTREPVMQEPFTEAVRVAVSGILPPSHRVGVVTVGTHSGVRVTCQTGLV